MCPEVFTENGGLFGKSYKVTLDLYKDPSGKFIIVTNCRDHKALDEFFKGVH